MSNEFDIVEAKALTLSPEERAQLPARTRAGTARVP